MRRTLQRIPKQVSDPIERVESEGGSEDGFSGIFDGVGQSGDQLDNVCGAEGFGCDKVCKDVSVEHCMRTTRSI